MVRTVIFDDDLGFCRILKPKLLRITEKYGLPMEVKIAENKTWLMEEAQKYDVCFMDISMPGLSGIDAAKSLRKESPGTEVVFVSAYEQYVRESIYAKPLAFVRKSNLEKDLEEAVKALAEVWRQKNRTVLLTNNTKQVAVTPAEILYCQSIDHYVRIFETHDGSKMIRSSLNRVEAELAGYCFLRVHARYLVNMDYVESVAANKICMQDGSGIPVSYKYRQRVRNTFLEQLRKHSGSDTV